MFQRRAKRLLRYHLMIIRLMILSRLVSILARCFNLRYPVHYPFGSRRAAARSGLLRNKREREKKRTMRVPFVPFTFYYDDSGRSVDVR